MVIMSDAEAFGLKFLVAIYTISCLLLLIFRKPNEPIDYPTPPEPVVIVDTLYLADTVFITKKSKPDTVYITNKDTI